MINTLSYLRELNMCSMMLRVVLAMLVGGIVGFEREKRGVRLDFAPICW